MASMEAMGEWLAQNSEGSRKSARWARLPAAGRAGEA